MASSKKLPPITEREEEAIQREIAANPDAAEATDEELANARPFAEAFPELAADIKRSRGRPRLSAPKQQVTIRLEPEVLAKFRASGANWQARINEILKRAKV